MVVVTEITDLIGQLAGLIKDTREIISAVNDGKAFPAKHHPQAKGDFSELLTQMNRAVDGLAQVTGVLTGFRFVTTGKVNAPVDARELARFNEHVIGQKTQVKSLKAEIRKLKADCHKVAALRDKLDAQTRSRAFGSMFGLLGHKSRARSMELTGTLGMFYADDMQMIAIIQSVLKLAERALREVEKTLGPMGTANPHCVPAAARVLQIYAELFDGPHDEIQKLADRLSDLQTELVA